MTYAQTYARSDTDPAGFWATAAAAIDWVRPPNTILDDSKAPFYRWFRDGVLNTCYNALDRHVQAGHGDRLALIYDSPLAELTREFSYRELTELTAQFAGTLRALGVDVGDRVVLYMPMIPETVIAMLACARIGAVHSVVFGGFAAPELAKRISDAKPKIIIAASCGIEPSRVVAYKPLLDRALELSEHTPAHCIIVQRPQLAASTGPIDLDYDELMASTTIEPADCVPLAATDPLYILYTSGTTGTPKGVVRDNGGHAVALSWSMANIYDIGPGDVMFTASDVGWVVGHSYIVYGPLLAGATTVLYEGKPVGTPDPGAFWRVVEDYRVKTLFTAPTAIRALKRDDPTGDQRTKYDTTSLRNLFLAGERLDPETYRWANEVLETTVTDHWWQTETGWPIAANPRGLESLQEKPGSATVPMPGYTVHILDESGNRLGPDEEGALSIRLPLPPGALTGLWRDDRRYADSYLARFPGYYLTGDGGYIDKEGYLFVLGRTDDVMNVAGHRLSSGQLEAAISTHPGVAECAVIGVQDALKGQVPRALVVTKAGYACSDDDLAREVSAIVRREVGPIASLSHLDVVNALPKTRSGKILRSTLRHLADGANVPTPATIDNPGILDELRTLLTPQTPAPTAKSD